ncbi:MAG: NAD(P)-binding protein [Parvularculaceae bacterium]|nr:NAD(P)-binding protein [Parvularculaceae bacterium]
MAAHDTDYLIIGAGAVGLAFADTLLAETDAHITIVDRHGKPGGHWNDAYSFVTLHQPSAFYGVNSMMLGENRKDVAGPNAGYYELASGAEVSGYFDKVMNQRLLPSGRVSYHPLSDYRGDGRFVSKLSGAETTVNIRRKTVDASYYGTTVPSTHTPKFSVGPGVRLVPPNALPHLWKEASAPARFVILGAGKTAMDVGVYLLSMGADPAAITWVTPRDSWLLNRRTTQPGQEFFTDAIGGQADLMGAIAEATSADDLFLRLEACGVMLRIDPRAAPSMFHYATISTGEVEILRRITDVVRLGRVRSIDEGGMTLDEGRIAVGPGALYIDCTATAVERRPTVPVYQPGLITLQMVRIPQPAFSAALCAFLEAAYDDDAQKNALCNAVPLPDTLDQYLIATLANLGNQLAWSQDKRVRRWIYESRLDGFGKVIGAVSPDDADKQAVIARLKANAMRAAMNLQTLIAKQTA